MFLFLFNIAIATPLKFTIATPHQLTIATPPQLTITTPAVKGTVNLNFFFQMNINSRAYCKTHHVGRMWNFNPEIKRNSIKWSPPVSWILIPGS